MTYQDTLKEHLSRRIGVNPRYSLRAFARGLGLEPSKLSEILSGKKGLSAERADQLCERLRLKGKDRDLFLLSVQAQHSRIKAHRSAAAKKIKELLLARNISNERTRQKNAWYFGAVKLAREAGIDVARLAGPLQLADLQIENANRYCGRIRKIHPERNVISYEPVSLMKKLNEDFSDDLVSELDAEFVFLSEEQATTLSRLIKEKISEFTEESHQENKLNLYMCISGFSKLCSKEEIC